MEWMILPLKRYADFQGRSRRMEYWMFMLGIIIAAVIIVLIESILGMGGSLGDTYGPLSALFLLGIFIPSLAVQVRRFHDQDRSGWFVLLGFIPLLGGLIVFIFMCLEGTSGPNSYGPDPKSSFDEDVFS